MTTRSASMKEIVSRRAGIEKSIAMVKKVKKTE